LAQGGSDVIFGLLRLGAMAFIIMVLVSFVLSWWSRGVRRKKLEAEWDTEVNSGDREAYVEEGLEDYDTSLRRKLIFGVFIVPYLVIAVLVYVVNYQ
jgi:predicted permease